MGVQQSLIKDGGIHDVAVESFNWNLGCTVFSDIGSYRYFWFIDYETVKADGWRLKMVERVCI